MHLFSHLDLPLEVSYVREETYLSSYLLKLHFKAQVLEHTVNIY